MRRAPKRDGNEAAIIAALRAVGASVTQLDGVGVPDLVVGWRGKTHLLEVKDGGKPPSHRRLTPAQREWHAAWRGGSLVVVADIDAALAAIGAAVR